MTIATELRAGPVILTAPSGGRVRLHAPRALCGELEVFEAHETIATITNEDGSQPVAAPGDGFLVRALVAEGATVEPDSPLLVFSVTG